MCLHDKGTSKKINPQKPLKPGAQTYSYPIASVKVASGSKTVTVAPGSGGSLFKQVGRFHPHLYAPNELFAQDWVYARLVKYGENGVIEPSLAEKWETTEQDGGWRVVFTLRKNAKFHDGEPWNCAAAKLKFDHVLHPKVKGRHDWFRAANIMTEWGCEPDDSGNFFIKTDKPYYPLLQELSYIRPLAFASPKSFAEGIDSHPERHNSCHEGGFGEKHEEIEKEITCLGLDGAIGTGPFRFVGKDTKEVDAGETVDSIVRFERFEEYWGTVPEIENVEVRHYEDTDAVKDDLISGELDMALGLGPLSAHGIRELNEEHKDKVKVSWSSVQQHAMAVLNTAKAPTDDIEFRKAILYGIDKDEDIITAEFADIRVAAEQLLPRSLPHCNVKLEPRFTFDLERARGHCDAREGGSSSLSGGAIAGIVLGALGGLALLVTVLLLLCRRRPSKKFVPEPMHVEAEQVEGFS